MKALLPSTLQDGSSAAVRERLFTPWMSPEQLQEHTDRMVGLGMISLYSEFLPDSGFREIYWKPTVPVFFEVRSGRALEEFLELQRANEGRHWPLLTLHVGQPGPYYSAVWLDEAGRADALPVLEALGIGLASAGQS